MKPWCWHWHQPLAIVGALPACAQVLIREVFMNAQQLIVEANELPVEERARIVDSLLYSLNPPSSAIDQQWLELAHRRLAEIHQAAVEPVAADGVFNKLWSRLGK
ncbi:hypothetical protein CJA_3303 [Cellvibrio japonicus Ueda107]|uniref:Addiction module component, TIGR02574 family n=2 Tax=Cellvibrio japonicus TaxID=155077 RepID=B3PEK1_CELJU|nr:hypothetical protein CJA_3303 [Cellvibrio japonicus Ueda107]